MPFPKVYGVETLETGDEPVTLEAAKLHLRVSEDDTADDDLISALISGARAHAEQYCRVAFIEKTVTLRLPAFPPNDGAIFLPIGPLRVLDGSPGITYADPDNAAQTLGYPTHLRYLPGTLPPRLVPVYGTSWPAIRGDGDWESEGDTSYLVTVLYAAGYTTPPAPVVAAIKLIVGSLYENRESFITGTIATEIPLGVKALLDPYRWLEVP